MNEIERIRNRYYHLLVMDTRDARRALDEESSGWVSTLLSRIDELERLVKKPAHPGEGGL